MSDTNGLLRVLSERGPLVFRSLPPDERAWRGRYLLMAAAMGASPVFAWANALAGDVDGSVEQTRSLVAATDDDAILDALTAAGVRIDDLLPY